VSWTLAGILLVLAAVAYVVVRMRDGARDAARSAVDNAETKIREQAHKDKAGLDKPEKPLTREQTRAELNRIRDLGRK